jgi:hypothetical protein
MKGQNQNETLLVEAYPSKVQAQQLKMKQLLLVILPELS